ncbi:helix-turn-helix transcriptional regulator [Salinarimonas sp.]|uniref:helix-turn-helix transcriptional regulator n=1 Tax=Salinarimonas sp. TaxID=2766526 RepID=UPI00391C745C
MSGVTDPFVCVEALRRAETREALRDAPRDTLEHLGLTYSVVTGLPKTGAELGSAILHEDLPAGWREHYLRSGFLQHDPVARRCRISPVPFAWSEAPYDPVRDPFAARVMAQARAAGMRSGFCVPVFGVGGSVGCVSFSGADARVAPKATGGIVMLALGAYEAAARIADPERRTPRRALTDRERQVLMMLAKGHCTQEIARRLGIAERTALAHISSSCRKLDAVNRNHAVAIAINERILLV